MKKLILLLAFLPTFLFAQDGINFQHNTTWQKIQAEAKAQHKFIFMDCFTTWCGPCRFMSSTIFPQKAVGDNINASFISVAVQLDTTEGDNDAVKSWYSDAHNIAQQYNIRAYPTYLFFDENGNLVHRIVGSTQTPEEFIAKADNALNPKTQYYTLLKEYDNGKNDTAFLHSLALMAQDAYDLKKANSIANKYIDQLRDLYTKDNLDFVSQFTQTSKDKGFAIMLHTPKKVDAVMGDGYADRIVQNIILQEDIYPVIFAKKVANKKDLAEPDWAAIQTDIQKKYPTKTNEVIAYSKVVFYMRKNDWSNFAPSVTAYMKLYENNVSDDQLNNFAWTVFQNCDDMTCVADALDWSKKSFADNNNPGFMDTYANILYKMGKKDDAISWETKAMNLAPDSDKKGYQETIDKMKAGEKTWN
jgi:thioredoxin-related protein